MIPQKREKVLRGKSLLCVGICCLWFFGSAAASPSLAFEKSETPKTGHVSVGVGWEILNYREHEPDERLESEADASNWVIDFDASKQWGYIFTGLKGIVPVHRNEDIEKWRISDVFFQENSFKYGWTRFDGFLGYELKPFLNPFFGLRWSESKQERAGFVVAGSPIQGSATEEVTAWFASLGVMGNIPIRPRWRLSYSGSYFIPISSEVENSNLPGWEVTDTGGYTFEFDGRMEYAYTESISVSLGLYGGKMHWDGSEWTSFGDRLVKWPENDTRYFGGMVNIEWDF